MGLSYDITLDREQLKRLRAAFRAAPDSVKKKFDIAAHDFANEVAEAAAGRVTRHPSGLWKKARMTGYQVRDRSDWVVQVMTPGGASGKAMAMSEFASIDRSGKKLGASLDRIYGPPGRILWAAYDERETAWIRTIEDAVAEAAAEIEGGR